MKRTLLNLPGMAMSVRHILLICLYILAGLTVKAQCPPIITPISSAQSQIVTPTSASICSGDSILMTCAPSTGTTWQWYKDGAPIPGATKSTYYGLDNANYTVRVGGCLSASLPILVTLKPLPVLWITPTATELCNGQQVTLTVTAGTNVGWVWLAPNPSAIYLKNTNPVTPNVTTTTTFQVVGGDQITGCAKTDAVTVVVYPVLQSGSIQPNSQICPGEIPSLITSTPATGSNGVYTYQWQKSTTSATTGFTNIPGANSPTYQPGPTVQTTWYRLITSSSPCGSENSNTVVVQVNPNPALTSPPAKSICSGNNVNYHPTSNIAGSTFTWTATVTSGSVSGVTASGNGDIHDVLSLPAGSTTAGKVTYVITPIGPAPSSCPGTPMSMVVTVNPIPLVTNSPLSQDICAGTFNTPINLQSNLANTTFTWTATATPGISGYLASGSGNIPSRQILSSLLVAGTVKFTITPHGPAPASCDGPSVVYTINVNPSPSITNNPMQQTICTGGTTTDVTLTSNIISTTFTWTASAVPASITGYQASGTSTLPAQTLINPSNVPGVVTYHIIPSGSINGCPGVPRDYTVTVNPEPIATATPAISSICSGQVTNIALSSTVAGTTFNWTASGAASLSGFSNGTGNPIAQIITNSSDVPEDVTYIITPEANGCPGTPITAVVTVYPTPSLTTNPLSQTICTGNTATISLTGTPSNATFSWIASGAGITGYSNGSGTSISQTLTNTTHSVKTAVYAISVSANGCTIPPVNYVVTVNPQPSVTNNPLTATRCSGTAFNLALTSDVTGTNYSWTANGTPGISGYTDGFGGTINQTLVNSLFTPGSVDYTITPTANGCPGTPVDYIVTVNPIPDVNLSLANQSICSGTPITPVSFSSSVAGTTYTWSASPSGPGITGYTASGSASIQSQIINSTLSVQGTVTYTVTPSFSGCTGPSANHIVTINPIPMVTNAPMSQTICTGATSSNVNLLSNVAGTTFTWIATASSAAITGFQASGGNTIPPQTITNSSTTPGTVTYKIIPTSNFGPNCPGIAANYTITINPLPSITSPLSADQCSDKAFNYSITSNLAGTTFTWTRPAISGISNPAATGSSSTISETLFNTTSIDIDVQYFLTPIGQAPTFCPGNTETLVVKVRALPLVNAGVDLTIPYGTNTSLNGTASGGTGALSYAWTPNSYIGAGNTTLTPQTLNLNATRTYTLTVSDVEGCSANDQMTVFVSGSPLAAAPTAIPSTICVGETSTLNANATGGSGTYTYSWTSLPAGFTSTVANPNVSPSVNTTYNVTVNDGFNSAFGSVTVNVNPLPVQYVLTGGGSYCSGGPGVVVGLGGSQSGVSYQLYNNSNPVGAPVSGNGAPMSFGNQTAAGAYTVRATRTSTGCSLDMGSSVSVSINPLPIPDAGLDQVIPFGTNTTLFGTTSSGFGVIDYSWSPSAFIVSGGNTFSPTTTNVYSNITYTLSVTDANGCTGSDQVAVSLSGSAISIVAVSGPDEICADSSQAQLTAIVTGGTGIYSYLWTNDTDPSWTSTDQNPMVSPDVTTTYTVTVNDGFNSAVASANILVHPLPLEYSVTGGGPYCFAGSGAAIGLSGSEPFTNYQLFRGNAPDGPPVTGTGSPISFGNRTASFTYTVLATKNITGCTKLMNGSATIIIVAPPLPYLVTGGGSYPFGGPGREIGLNHGDNGISYQLYYNNTAIGTPVTGTGSPINFGYQTQAGTYTVVGTDIATGCTIDMNGSVNITITPLPVIFDVIGGGIICQGEPGLPVSLTGSETGINYQLLLNGIPYGPVVAGTNSPLDWGPLSISGLFEVRAINPITGSTQMMNDSAVIIVNPATAIFSIAPAGSQCSGTIIRLNGSENGIMYYLELNGIVIDSIPGTGSIGFLDFGARTAIGTYTISAVNTSTGCRAIMHNSTYINVAPQVFNVTPAGVLCQGEVITLSGSEIGVNYQLRWNGTFDIGVPVPGTGAAIDLGTANLPGTYSVVAINAVTNCVSFMADSATLSPAPTAFSMIPDGPTCEGSIVGLNGSEPGVDYVLVLDNAIHLDTISGTGLPISFGPQMTEGNYTILAINQTTYCSFPMNGTTIMNDSPINYSLLPSGIQCAGIDISLSGSQAGVSYQLILDGKFSMGAPVTGTGGAISFGPQSLSGTYTVRAINNTTGCNSIMNDSTVLEPLPTIFTTTPAGSFCSGNSIGLNGSQPGINYILVLNGTINIDTIQGTGSPINFGAQSAAGTYSVIAYNPGSFCSNPMNGNSIIKSAPAEFNITPEGNICLGTTVGLDNSEPGVIYQLRRDGITNVGVPVTGTGSAISFGVINIPGTYTVIATNSFNGCAITMNGSAVIHPNPLVFAIMPQGMHCAGDPITLNGSQVGINYILVRDNAFTMDTISGNGGVIDFGPQYATGKYTIEAFSTSTACNSLMSGSVEIMPLPVPFNITPAGISCGYAVAGLDGSEPDVAYTLYKDGISTGITIPGTGSAISFGLQTPGDYTVKAVKMGTNCSIFMPGSLKISKPAVVNSGADATICSTQPVMLNASVNLGGAVTWASSGDGVFDNTSNLTAVYTPGAMDIASGKVNLFLSTFGLGSCSLSMVTDTLTVTIDPLATANAGANIDVCSANELTIKGATAINAKTISWTSTGTGGFININTISPTYLPTTADRANGSVTLTLHVTGNSPCNNAVNDDLVMTFHPEATVYAGADYEINAGSNFTVTTASATNNSGVLWSTAGSGTFTNGNTLTATYNPSIADYAAGSVILTLTAFSNPPCNPVVDNMVLSFKGNPGVEFSWDITCENQPITFIVDSAVANIHSIASWLWNFGDGHTSNSMNPTHTYAGSGDYTISLTAKDLTGSSKTISHTVTIIKLPGVYFTYNRPNCSNETMQFTDLSFTTNGYITGWVWNYGDGSANDTVMFPNDPNVRHRYSTAGTFNTSLTIFNSLGCSNSVTIPVELIAAPIANFQHYNDCSGLETSFKDASFSNGEGNTVLYGWHFGDPASGLDNYSDLKDATHTFSTPGTYQIMHIVRNFNNCVDTTRKTVVIRPPLLVDFVHTPTCLNSSVDFGPDATIMNVTDITNWTWDFGDGVSTFTQNTNHTYTSPGTYQVKLTVTNTAGCTASKTRTVIVNQRPVSMFNATLLTCQDDNVHFDDISTTYAGNIVEWNWSFGDGNTQKITPPANADTDHAYAAPGTYTIRLSILSSDGCTAESLKTIVVKPSPKANFDYTNTCQGAAVKFSDISQLRGAGSIISWAWDFGDDASGASNNSSLRNPLHTYTAKGSYLVTLKVTVGNGCSSVMEKTITITEAPFADFTFDNHCVGNTVQFTPAQGIDKTTVATWKWIFGDGSTSNLPEPQYVYKTPGTYNVVLIIKNLTGCESTVSHSLAILQAPIASYGISTTACSEQRVEFTDQSSAAAGYITRWEYNFGDGTTAVIRYPKSPNVSHIYTSYGTFNTTLTVVTNDSCSATASHTVKVLQSPLANFNFVVNCKETPVPFTDKSQGSIISWAWNFGDPASGSNNTSNQQNPVHTYQKSGTYQVTLLVQNANGCSDTVARTFTFAPQPVVDFIFNKGCAADSVHFVSSTYVNLSTTASWEWQFGDNTTSADADPDHIYSAPGTYTVTLTITNQNGCTNFKTRQVQVTAAPVAKFTSPTSSCSGTAILFTDISSTQNGVITTRTWDFGDGTGTTVTVPANPNVTHVYESAGMYDVILTIQTSAGCEATYTSKITTSEAPETSFSFAGTCNQHSTTFTDQSQSAGNSVITGWSWNFGNPTSGTNNVSVLPNPQHMFSEPGTYIVTLTTENTLGCSGSMSQEVKVTSKPAVDFKVISSCGGTTPVSFGADPVITNIPEVSSYLWNFGDGTTASTLASPDHIFAKAGNYNVTLTITNLSGCENTISHTVTAHAYPVAQFTFTGNCADNLLQFTDNSYNPDGTGIVAWSWDFGVVSSTNNYSTLQNPSHLYTEAGTYNVTLTVTSAKGCTAVKTIPVTVIPAPEVKFSYTTEPCHSGSVLFRNESISTQSLITGWKWEFAPGVYSTLQNPVHVFGDTETSYDVKLTVTTANGCTNSTVQEVHIPAGLKVDVNYTQTCVGEPTWFTPKLVSPFGGSLAYYSWNFGDPLTGYQNQSKLQNPQHTFSKAGTFVIALQATDINNCTTTSYTTITVDALPVADFRYTGGQCDTVVHFTDMTSGSPIARWTWNFGDGKITTVDSPDYSNVEHTYPYAGEYEVTLTTESVGGCIDTFTKKIRRTPCITAKIAVKDTLVCQKRSMKFSEASVCEAPIARWQWFFGDGSSVTYTTPQKYVEHTYANSGNYKAKLVVSTNMVGGMVTDTASNQVIVKPAAKAAYQWTDVCVGSTTEFENQTKSNNTSIKSYLWNFGVPASSDNTTTQPNPQHKYEVQGQYDVKLIVTNTLGCTDTLTKKINIFGNPDADIETSNGCETKPVEFTTVQGTSTPGIVNWNWEFSNAGEVVASTAGPSCSYSFSKAGVYDVDLNITDQNGCKNSISKQITINASPIAAFSITENYENKQGQVQLTNGTINGTDYEWTINNGNTTYDANPVITFDKEGHYIIQLISKNGQTCSDTMELTYDLMYKGLYVPNAFSPGHMDAEVAVFKPKGTNLKTYYVEIRDSWNNLLWSSDKLDAKGSPAESWDGTIHGQLLKEDVYLWKISAQFRDGQVWDGKNTGNNTNMPQTIAGTVTIIR